jgi:hypothetical protein
MESKEILYSEIREKAFQMLENNSFPENVVFCSGSAFCFDVKNAVFDKMIPNIDLMVEKRYKTPYDKKEMLRRKENLYQILIACENPANCNLDPNEWAKEELEFSNSKHKLLNN